MEAITADRGQNVCVNEPGDLTSKDDKRRGTVTNRSYVMNDLGALRKKVKHESRKHNFIISNEAKDSSNTVIQMKTSFFEFTKAKFIEEILQNQDIVSVQNAEAVKAATETSGEAYVEFSMDITFKAKEKTHSVKMIAYTTTCQLMIQPKGEPSGVKIHLGSRGTPRYFAETFLIPWCEKSVDSNNFNEKMSGIYLDALNEEIKRMEASKTLLKNEVKKKTKQSVLGEIANAKCVNKGCSFKGLDPNNKSAVGVCTKCCNFEHFACIKMKPEHKDDIIKGNIKFYCSECFSKNPSIGTSKARPRLDSLPLLGQGYLFKVSKSVTATAAPPNTEENASKAITEVYICDICPFETNNQDDLRSHKEGDHSFKCDHCAVQARTQGELANHILQHHTVPCNICDTKTLRTEADLEIHMTACHSFPCNDKNCNEIFTTTTLLTCHMKSNHSTCCSVCDENFDSQSALEEHYVRYHKSTCDICEETFSDKAKLREHHISFHEFQCSHCEAILTSEPEKDKHVKENHRFYCGKCETVFETQSEMIVHNESHTSTNLLNNFGIDSAAPANNKDNSCMICETKYDNDLDLMRHIDKEHTHACDICDSIFRSKTKLKDHAETHPKLTCEQCDFIGYSAEALNNHIPSHQISCQICSHKCKDKSELDVHLDNSHQSICRMCGKEENSKEDLNNHIMSTHTYKCDICDLIVTGEVCMEDHILDKHAVPDSDKIFRCDDCTFASKDKRTFGKHYKENHGHEATKLAHTESALKDENKKLSTELKEIKNNFERLESLYQDSLEEVNQVKSEYEAKMVSLKENYEVVKTENEVLKEKIDILFKLGRSYIDKENKNEDKKAEPEKQNEKTNDNDIIEVLEVAENNTKNNESLEEWTKMKMRGFKRLNPAASPIQNSTALSRHNAPSFQKRKPPTPETASPSSPPPFPPPPSSQTPPSTESTTPSGRARYCHYFVNTGRCRFEENTGKQCKFEHKQAPMCRSGINCTRPKCMFSHPKINGNSHFLGNMRPPTTFMPWQMINPWIPGPQTQYQLQSNPQDPIWNVGRQNTH